MARLRRLQDSPSWDSATMHPGRTGAGPGTVWTWSTCLPSWMPWDENASASARDILSISAHRASDTAANLFDGRNIARVFGVRLVEGLPLALRLLNII